MKTNISLVIAAAMVALITGCNTGVPTGKTRIPTPVGEISFDSPKQVIIEEPKFVFNTNGTYTFSAKLFVSTNEASIAAASIAASVEQFKAVASIITNVTAKAAEKAP